MLAATINFTHAPITRQVCKASLHRKPTDQLAIGAIDRRRGVKDGASSMCALDEAATSMSIGQAAPRANSACPLDDNTYGLLVAHGKLAQQAASCAIVAEIQQCDVKNFQGPILKTPVRGNWQFLSSKS